jgi:hypothetical protein
MSKIISSFTQVELTNGLKYLIICDIDETILHFPNCDLLCENLVKDLRLKDEDYENELKLLKFYYKNIMAPKHTDYDGFVNMLKKINETNGKLIFLTARNLESDNLTKKHLKQIGISPDEFEIHYTSNKITKGEYIRKHIDLCNWENVIFIDDYDIYIKTVTDIYPEIICYKFDKYQKEK